MQILHKALSKNLLRVFSVWARKGQTEGFREQRSIASPTASDPPGEIATRKKDRVLELDRAEARQLFFHLLTEDFYVLVTWTASRYPYEVESSPLPSSLLVRSNGASGKDALMWRVQLPFGDIHCSS